MANFTRRDLKSDRFAEEVGHQVEYLSHHRKGFFGAVTAIIVVVAAVLLYSSWRSERRQEAQQALQEALRLYHGEVTADPRMGMVTFATTGERFRRTTEELEKVKSEHGGEFGAAADYYLALLAVERDEPEEAQRLLQSAVDGADERYSSLARLALAELLSDLGQADEARRHFDYLIEHPSAVVPKARAQLELGRHLMQTDPEQARTTLEQLMSQPGPAGVAAGVLLRQLQGA